MKIRNKPAILLGLLFIAAVITSLFSPQKMDWSFSFSKYDDKPFSISLLFELLENQRGELQSSPVPLLDFDRIGWETNESVYIIINNSYDPDEVEVNRLLNRVEDGMTVFIAGRLVGDLPDTLGVKTFLNDEFVIPELVQFSPSMFTNEPVSFPSITNQSDKNYHTKQVLVQNFFTIENNQAVVLARFDDKPILVSIPHGKGAFLLLSAPLLLTNYHIWDEELEATSAAVISHIPRKKIIWDDYYHAGTGRRPNAIAYLVSRPSLKAGYYVFLSFMVLFLIFRVRRMQRPVPVIEPPVNASKSYIEKTGALYQSRDREGRILNKRIRFLARELGIETHEISEKHILNAATKFRIDEDKLTNIFRHYQTKITADSDIMKINARIDELYKNLK